MGLSAEEDVAIGFVTGILVGFYIATAFKLSFFGLSRLATELIGIAMVTSIGYFIRIFFLAVTVLFILGTIVRFRENGIAVLYTFLIGLFLTFL